MTFAELKADTYRRLQEAASGPVFATATDVATALNAGYMELSDATAWHEEWRTIDLLAKRPYYDMRTVIGDTFLAVGPAFNETTSRWLTPTTAVEMDAADRRWERVAGEPQKILVRGFWWVGYWPRVNADAGTIKQYLITLPDALSADTDEPGFPVEFHQGIADYAVADLLAQDAETTHALRAWDAYLAQETALLAWVQARAQVPMTRRYGL